MKSFIMLFALNIFCIIVTQANESSAIVNTTKEEQNSIDDKAIMKESKSNPPKGRLDVICGPMFSGKTEELIRRIKRAELGNLKVNVFKNKLDDRVSSECINSHNGQKFQAIPLENPEKIKSFIDEDTKVIAIDEVQFFSPKLIPIILELINQGKRVVVAGLDLDFKGMPFGCVPTLLALADSVTKLTSVCMHCGKDAQYSQRFVNGRPAQFDDPVIMVGAQEKYQARCRECFIIDKQEWPIIETNHND